MRRAILPMIVLCSLARAQEDAVTDWRALDLDVASLGTWGTRSYSYSVRDPGGGESTLLGTVTMKTALSGDLVLLRDRWDITYRGTSMSLDLAHTCRGDNYLTPVRIESRGEGDDELGTFVALVDKGRATVVFADGREEVRDLPEGTITMAAMMRLVALVPQTPGRAYTYPASLESEELNLKKDYRLLAQPPEVIEIGGRQIRCARFELTGGGIRPVYYWVSEDGSLQRVVLDERKVLELQPAP